MELVLGRRPTDGSERRRVPSVTWSLSFELQREEKAVEPWKRLIQQVLQTLHLR